MKKNFNIIRSYSYLNFIFSIFLVVTAFFTLLSSNGIAYLNTECCIDCHAFHAWQDKAERDSKRLYASVLEENCEGCHASYDTEMLVKSGLNIIPIVKSAEEPKVPLSGGNFYYISGQIHLEKAGYCTSCHRDVRHHATKAGYRFLGEDIEGIGDPMYEYGDGHNIYKSGDKYCNGCHNDYCGSKNQRSGTGWIRHPTNIPLPMSGEYAGYKVYRKDVPVSYPDLKKPERSNAHIMCISCHRPHGTPYNFLLRWDYNTILAGSGNNLTGCFACHTTKDIEEVEEVEEVEK